MSPARTSGVPDFSILRAIAKHASPILIAQLASMSTAIVDTLITARVDTIDLAAVGIGAGLYMSVMLAGAGVVQGLTPIAAHHVGAKRFEQLPATLQQGLWLCLALALVGSLILATPDWLLTMNDVSPAVAERTRAYLAVLALALPGTLVYRACGGMLNALGRPRMLMFFGLANAGSHVLLAPALAFGWLGLPALGAVGCAASVALNTTLLAIIGLVYLARSPVSREFKLLRHWSGPRWSLLAEHLKLGLPIGLSTFVEMSSFALIGLLVAGLGAEAVGANRLLGNFAGTCYMLPLSISIATLSLVGQAAGARDWARVRRTAGAGMALGCTISMLVGITLWLLQTPLINASVPDPAVRNAAWGLVGLIAFYQLFDAAQTIAAQALRGLKITTLPMLVHVFSFWGVGLAGGWWLCYRGVDAFGISAQGLAGFWQAGVASSGVAALLFTGLLWATLRRPATV
ncbi:MATE family efflux transporter [Uliginosibacterium sp. 31-16]|uniref:MATE family efflux transporter n=1 Tax=Uliginosibacterium sp. 31-16 TaxID=3068315 RepID=UPI00273F6684|nr:MATE family efflux transporter [Uliginosibacterium sp. 31-16]MDP5240336.1 MATE family efflux transporter [Uliginosibacterium sp. 31-16]